VTKLAGFAKDHAHSDLIIPITATVKLAIFAKSCARSLKNVKVVAGYVLLYSAMTKSIDVQKEIINVLKFVGFLVIAHIHARLILVMIASIRTIAETSIHVK
jgi:hypothetical protein